MMSWQVLLEFFSAIAGSQCPEGELSCPLKTSKESQKA